MFKQTPAPVPAGDLAASLAPFGQSRMLPREAYVDAEVFEWEKRNIFSARFWAMLRDVSRFYRHGPKDLAALEAPLTSLDDYLAQKGYCQAFRDDHLLPQAAAIWSTPLAAIGAYPAAALIRFFQNHGMMTVFGRGLWRTVEGGSRSYVRKLAEAWYCGQFRVGKFIREYPHHVGPMTDILIGRIFHPEAGEIFNDLDPWLERMKAEGVTS